MSLYMNNANPLHNPSNLKNFLPLSEVKMGARAELELHHPSDLKQKSIKTECLRFLVKLCCQIKKRVSLQEMKILTALDPILATNSNQQNSSEILPLIARFRHLLIETELDALGEEWDELPHVVKIFCTFDATSMTPPQFWKHVKNLQSGVGELPLLSKDSF